MSLLNIELGSCVKVFSKNSSCTSCADICPETSISYLGNIPQLASSCTDCGLCLGVCPTEATSIKDKNPLEFAFKFLEQKDTTMVCAENILCNGLLHVEHIISLALLSTHESLDYECCEQCYQTTFEKVNETNFFLEKLGNTKRVKIYRKQKIKQEEEPTQNRREFFKRLSLKGVVKSKLEFDREINKIDTKLSSNDTANIRKKELPDRRKFLYMALKRVDKLSVFEKLEPDSLSFISQKIIDSSCDNCSICYRVCPTGALQSDKRGTRIEFDALSCVKCRLCHDVCESDSIKLSPFDTKNIFEPRVEKLIDFNIVSCNDCGNFFTYLGGEPTCNRCKLEEQEAKELWGIR